MTVTRTSSPRASSMTAPKMMLASTAAELATSWAASLISKSPRSEPPWMDSSTPWAPWYVIPANKKWFRNLAVSQILVETLEEMDPRFPKPAFDPAKLVVK